MLTKEFGSLSVMIFLKAGSSVATNGGFSGMTRALPISKV
jgi:hypothetical protein